MARNYYVDGNTVRQAEEPVVRPQEQRPRKSRKQIAEEHRQQQAMHEAKKNRETSVPFRRAYAIFLSGCVIAIAACSFVMVQTQASITNHMRACASLESQVAELKAENDAKYNEIYASVDLDHIKEVAVNELGMTYASEDQVVYYNVDKSNYMDQYSDIPQ